MIKVRIIENCEGTIHIFPVLYFRGFFVFLFYCKNTQAGPRRIIFLRIAMDKKFSFLNHDNSRSAYPTAVRFYR